MPESISVPGLHHGGIPIPAAARRGPLVMSGGIAGLDRSDGSLPEGLEQQISNLFDNIRAIMAAAGGGVDDIVRLDLRVVDKGSRPLIDEQWLAMYPDESTRPARKTAQSDLSHGMLIQADITAFVDA